MGEKPDHLPESEEVNIIFGKPGHISVQVVCILMGLGTAFPESNQFSLLLAEQVGLGVSDQALSAFPNLQLPYYSLSSLDSETQSSLGTLYPFNSLVVGCLMPGQEFFCPPQPSRRVSLAGNLKTPSTGFPMTPALLTL